jgi:hypothetical protein
MFDGVKTEFTTVCAKSERATTTAITRWTASARFIAKWKQVGVISASVFYARHVELGCAFRNREVVPRLAVSFRLGRSAAVAGAIALLLQFGHGSETTEAER